MARARRRDRGGILGLFEILSEHGYAVEADLRRYYGVDMHGFWKGDITPRQLVGLLAYLPADSITSTLLRDEPEYQDWGLPEFLLGTITDRIGELVFITTAANVDEKTRNTLEPPKSVLPNSAIEKVIRDEVNQMSINEFFSPVDMFADIHTKHHK